MLRMIATAGAAYFALVFGAVFVFGTIRTLWVEPAIGVRAAELAEMPFMLAAILVAARWLDARFLRSASSSTSLAAGIVALTLVLLADVGVDVLLRGMSFAEVFVDRDAIAGTIYDAMLVVFAAMPWLLTARRRRKAA